MRVKDCEFTAIGEGVAFSDPILVTFEDGSLDECGVEASDVITLDLHRAVLPQPRKMRVVSRTGNILELETMKE